MIDVIRKAVRTREIKEKNAKIRAQKMSFYTSLIKSEDLPHNESAPLTFSLQFDVNLRHNFFLNLIFRLRKIIFQNLENKG